MSKSTEFAKDVAALLRSRNPLIWIVTREEERVERVLIEACAAASFAPQTWDVASGILAMDGSNVSGANGTQDPGDALGTIEGRLKGDAYGKPERNALIMRDLPVWITGAQGAATQRRLRNIARNAPSARRERAQAIIILSPSGDVPPELSNHAVVLELPMPDREEIGSRLDASIAVLDGYSMTEAERAAAIEAAVGLTDEEAAACFARSMVKSRTIDPQLIAAEKKRIVTRERILEWFDPLPGGLDSVGGLDVLKRWLIQRASAYSIEARAYGLPSPKGAFLVGVPGCGKSLTAKATATAFGVPLLKVDLGALKSKFVGESEQNLRKVFKVIEAIGRCVVWFDEIEKSLQGATSGSSDGGVSSDALGAVLNWMQERSGDAFVIATANDISALPPELLRKGRFDEIFYVDLPNQQERVEIVRASLKSYGRDVKTIDCAMVATRCEQFTGSEIAAIVPDALFAAFADSARPIATADLVTAAASVVPLSVTAAEKITKLREWAKGRARNASEVEVKTRAAGVRQIDV